jgi:hypothetical protein
MLRGAGLVPGVRAAAAAEEPPRSKAQPPDIASLTEWLRYSDPLRSADGAKRLLDCCRKKAPKADPPVSAAEVIAVCEAMVNGDGVLDVVTDSVTILYGVTFQRGVGLAALRSRKYGALSLITRYLARLRFHIAVAGRCPV